VEGSSPRIVVGALIGAHAIAAAALKALMHDKISSTLAKIIARPLEERAASSPPSAMGNAANPLDDV
jgi:hypothetical protein